jgi:hypothetical protein
VITFPRSVARACRAVFRRLLSPRRLGASAPPVGLAAGPGGVRLRLVTPEAGVEYHHPEGQPETLEAAVPLDALAECEARDSGLVTVRPAGEGKVELAWHEGAVPRTLEYAAPTTPTAFPDWPPDAAANDVSLLAALREATETASRDGGRFATDHVLLRGRTGQVVGTDGRQLFVHGGFRFPWKEDLLVPRRTLFAARELAGDGGVEVASAGGHVLVRVGRWTVAFRTATGRFPPFETVIPAAGRGVTRWHLSKEAAGRLVRALPGLPRDDGNAAVVLDLSRVATVVRARAAGHREPAELALDGSQVDGPPVRVATNRAYLDRALRLGFDAFEVLGPDKPIVCRDKDRVYLWMALGDGGVAMPEREAARPRLHVPGADRLPEPAPAPLGRRPQAGDRKIARAARAGFWRGVVAQVRGLVSTVRAYRRREERGWYSW